MVKFRVSHIQIYSSASFRKCFRIQYAKNVQLIRLGTVYQGHVIKGLHTTQGTQKQNQDKQSDKKKDEEEYEIDLITMKKRKKQKEKKQDQPKDNARGPVSSFKISDDPNVNASFQKVSKPNNVSKRLGDASKSSLKRTDSLAKREAHSKEGPPYRSLNENCELTTEKKSDLTSRRKVDNSSGKRKKPSIGIHESSMQNEYKDQIKDFVSSVQKDIGLNEIDIEDKKDKCKSEEQKIGNKSPDASTLFGIISSLKGNSVKKQPESFVGTAKPKSNLRSLRSDTEVVENNLKKTHTETTMSKDFNFHGDDKISAEHDPALAANKQKFKVTKDAKFDGIRSESDRAHNYAVKPDIGTIIEMLLSEAEAKIQKDIRSDNGLVSEKPTSDPKSDDVLVTEKSKLELAGADPKSDNELVKEQASNNMEASVNINDPLNTLEQEVLKDLHDSGSSNPLNYNSAKTHIPSQESEVIRNEIPATEEIDSKKEPDVVNISIPKGEEKSNGDQHPSIRYTTEPPKIDEFEKIINVSKPAKLSKRQRGKNSIKRNETINLDDLSNLSATEKLDKIDNIIKFLESEIPKLSSQKNFNESEINAKSSQMQQLRDRLSKVSKTHPNTGADVTIPVSDLEYFLKDAKKEKEQREEDEFRQSRAYEFSKSVHDQNYRTLNKKDFFTPIDEALAKRLTTHSKIFRPIRHEVRDSLPPKDELFFPSLSNNNKNLTHEFMILANDKRVITQENPLGEHHHTPDLFTIYRSLGNPEKYLKQINKLEKKGGWKLIGSGGDSNKILIFERFVDKEEEAKKARTQKIFRNTGIAGLLAASAFGLGAFYEYQQDGDNSMAQYRYDEQGKLVKANTTTSK